MAYANARLTPFGRLVLVQPVLELGWSVGPAAGAVGVSRTSAYKLLRRYREAGETGLLDRAPRPRRCPHALPQSQVDRILRARRRRRQGPHRLAWLLGLASSTIYGVLRRHGVSRLQSLDRASGVTIRYCKERAGELLHLDVKKLGRIPAGPGGAGSGAAATTSSTSPSTTPRGWPMWPPSPTNAAQPPPASSSMPPPASPIVACASNGS